MKYTIRFPHLAEESSLQIGETVRRGDLIGQMGSTGQSFGDHLHLDAFEGQIKGCVRSYQVINGQFLLAEDIIYQCLNYSLFMGPLTITYFIDDPRYTRDLAKKGIAGKQHKGLDILGHGSIYFPLDKGKVLSKYFDASGYGHAIHILYEV